MNKQSCKYRFEVSVDCDKAHVVHKMDHWCWQKQSNWYSGPILWIAMDICVIERMILNLFSDFHSSTLLTTDELRICYKSIIHSIIQSFNHLLLFSITNENETDRSTDLLCKSKNQRTKQPIHEWINDAHIM